MALKYTHIVKPVTMNKLVVYITYKHKGFNTYYSSSRTVEFLIRHQSEIELYFEAMKAMQAAIKEHNTLNTMFSESLVKNGRHVVEGLLDAYIPLPRDQTALRPYAEIEKYSIKYWDRFGEEYIVELV